VRLLLTSAGVKNPSIRDALVDLLGKPIADSSALCIPTAVLLVAGGDATYLCHWMRQSGLADLLPSLQDTVWVGLSAGSMVMTPRIGDDFVEWTPPNGGDSTLGVVDFLDLPAPGSHAGQHHGCCREMGGRDRGSGVRNRRPDGHQGDRRHRRGRLRGALEAVPLIAAANSDRRAAIETRGRGRRGAGVLVGDGTDMSASGRPARRPTRR